MWTLLDLKPDAEPRKKKIVFFPLLETHESCS